MTDIIEDDMDLDDKSVSMSVEDFDDDMESDIDGNMGVDGDVGGEHYATIDIGDDMDGDVMDFGDMEDFDTTAGDGFEDALGTATTTTHEGDAGLSTTSHMDLSHPVQPSELVPNAIPDAHVGLSREEHDKETNYSEVSFATNAEGHDVFDLEEDGLVGAGATPADEAAENWDTAVSADASVASAPAPANYLDGAHISSTDGSADAADGADGSGDFDYGISADNAAAVGSSGGADVGIPGGSVAEEGTEEAQEGLAEDIHAADASAGASDAVHEVHGPDGAVDTPAADDTVSHVYETSPVHHEVVADAGAHDGETDTAASEVNGSREHVSSESVDAPVEQTEAQPSEGVRREDVSSAPAECVETEAGVLDEGIEGPLAEEAFDELANDEAPSGGPVGNALDGGPGALEQGPLEEETPLEEAADEALQGHADEAHVEVEENTEDFYDESLDLDISAPVIVRFQDFKSFSLLPLDDVNNPEHYDALFDDDQILHYSMEEFFAYARKAVADKNDGVEVYTMDQELVVSCNQMGLDLGEDNICCKEATLMDFVRLFQTMAANTREFERPAAFELDITTTNRFISNYNRLFQSAQEGSSLEQLTKSQSDARAQAEQAQIESAFGDNVGKAALVENSAAIEAEKRTAAALNKRAEEGLEFAKQAFAKNADSLDPQTELAPELDTNYLPSGDAGELAADEPSIGSKRGFEVGEEWQDEDSLPTEAKKVKE